MSLNFFWKQENLLKSGDTWKEEEDNKKKKEEDERSTCGLSKCGNIPPCCSHCTLSSTLLRIFLIASISLVYLLSHIVQLDSARCNWHIGTVHKCGHVVQSRASLWALSIVNLASVRIARMCWCAATGANGATHTMWPDMQLRPHWVIIRNHWEHTWQSENNDMRASTIVDQHLPWYIPAFSYNYNIHNCTWGWWVRAIASIQFNVVAYWATMV